MASAAVPEEEHGCTGLVDCMSTSDKVCSELGRPVINVIKIKEQPSTDDDFAPKVRKPYTITKQRERWTDEEHKKFIEALKLYGRAWRKIEEHVGSKTAVQIRSHAQKFFSKVVRESTGGDASSVKPIEIPPPRPKRKPMHPYPRKLVSSVKTGIKIPEKQTSSASPNASEQDNQSPTSVLSAVGSDSSVEPDSCRPNGSPSSGSSALALNAGTTCGSEVPKLPSEGIMSSWPDHEDENSSPDEEIPLELEFSSQNSASVKEDPSEAAAQSFKLFGKTLLVGDASGSSSAVETCKPESFNRCEESCLFPWSVVPLRSPASISEYVWNASSDVYSAETKSNPVNICCPVPLSWLSLSGNMLQPSMEVHSPTPVKARLLSHKKEKAESNEWKEGYPGISQTNPSPTKQEEEILLTSGKLSNQTSTNCGKGFVPYKRCFSERGPALMKTSEDREQQRIRLC